MDFPEGRKYTCEIMNAPQRRFLDRTTPPHIVTLILIAGLSALSMNIFLPSLPKMAEHFNVDYGVMQLSVSLYLGVSAVLQILIGPLSDRYGRRKVLLAAIALFVLASIGTLLAPTAEMFLLFRMGQAVVATAMALSRAVVRDMVDEAQAASMLGYVTMGMAMVPMVGPVIGGFLDEVAGWQANFVVLLIAGVAIMALSWADLGETARTRPTSMMAQMRDYPELFASPRFWGYCLSSSFASGVFFAFLGGAPYVGTEIYGLNPTVLGALFGFAALGYGAGNFISGRFSVRMGVNRMILAGACITLGGLGLQAGLLAVGLAPAWVFFSCFALVGIGNGMVLPNATAGMLSVRPHLAGTASGLGGAIMIGGGAALSALAGMLLVPGAGAWPLVAIMVASASASLLAILGVIYRERHIRS
ncbi:MAG: MFS transporter, DHA1 family, bicyclomycin/chloramphenicol resistance protein [Rhodobacteraceae bacterium HLUCCA12]|nr:MAG: MFS transporter, DHA1 family, bicyclomycin/chloramphenicol resistance protein [Rhodobacteraceae bacterium HLUCCA12]